MNNLGGKANSLQFLKQNHFSVPKFFVITNDEFQTFLKDNNLLEKIEKLLNTKDFSQIRNLILKGNISKRLLEKIEKEWELLHAKKVAVRSSAGNEDGIQKSFAGQYQTFLHVEKSQIIEKIKECWASLFTKNVMAYNENLLSCEMNVIIQKMILSEFSGVCFTVDPVGSTNNYSVIEIIKGVGEKLVSGKITPTKYLVRKQTKHVDLQLGKLKMDDRILQRIERLALRIERIYHQPMDIEFAIKKNKIYILQARPITAFSRMKKPFSLYISREKSIIDVELYYWGEYQGIKRLTRNLYYFKPLILYNQRCQNVNIYYNEYDLEEFPKMMYYYMNLDYTKIKKEYQIALKNVSDLKKIIEGKKAFAFSSFFSKILQIYPFNSLGQLAGHGEKIPKRIFQLLIDFREQYDQVIHDALNFYLEKMSEQLQEPYKDYVNWLTYEEFQTKKFPKIEILEQRKKGFIYYEKLYVTSDYKKWLNDHAISLVKQENSDLSGQVAYPGNVTGTVQLVFNNEDLKQFKKGNILVTPMTTPKYVKELQEAKAFITDEGGFTCHAAIIARELEKTCIVGTKNATEILKNGWKIKINGSTGEIKILNKNKGVE